MSFSALPPVPTSGLSEAEFQLLAALTQNVSLLTGQGLSTYRALISGQFTVQYPADLSASPITSSGTTNDIPALAASLQALINDVQALRDTVNAIVTQLRS